MVRGRESTGTVHQGRHMDRLSSMMLRAGFVWLLAGIVIGAAMLIDRRLPGNWRVWMGPTHGHMLFVGWFAQFALGVGYWLLPRKRSPERPVGYDERPAFAAVIALNLGLLLRVAAEPWERAGHASDWTFAGLTASAILQVAAFGLFVSQLWGRVGPKAIRRPGTPAAPSRE
jgi:hypothetical protein